MIKACCVIWGFIALPPTSIKTDEITQQAFFYGRNKMEKNIYDYEIVCGFFSERSENSRASINAFDTDDGFVGIQLGHDDISITLSVKHAIMLREQLDEAIKVSIAELKSMVGE